MEYIDLARPKSGAPDFISIMIMMMKIVLFTLSTISLLLRRFVFRMAEASAKRVTGDELQGTMGRVQTASFARTFSERRLGTRQEHNSCKY